MLIFFQVPIKNKKKSAARSEAQSAGRSYRQMCGIALALDQLGDRWTLLVIRELLLGAKRYSDLIESLQGITTNLLAKRLKELRAAGLVESVSDPYQGARYSLTSEGQALEPVLLALGNFGSSYLRSSAKTARRNIAWLLFSQKRRYPGGLTLRVQFLCGERSFLLDFCGDNLRVEEGQVDLASLCVRGSEAAFFSWLSGEHDFFDLVEAQKLSLGGALEMAPFLAQKLSPLLPGGPLGPRRELRFV